MFARRQKTQNEIVARQMSGFFKEIQQKQLTPADVAAEYGRFMWRRDRPERLLKEKRSNRARFYLGLAVEDDADGFERVTKRAALVSDTLLLSHQEKETIHYIGGIKNPSGRIESMSGGIIDQWSDMDYGGRARYGMHCPDLEWLGRWLLDGRPLLEAGLAWYLPTYSSSWHEIKDSISRQVTPAERAHAVDYLVKDGRAIDSSGANPIKSALIRPVLSTDLPFIDGVGLRDFSRITVEEFDSYSAFRDFLRLRLLELDSAMNVVDSDRALARLGLEIQNEIRSLQADMGRARRKRLLVGSGATIATVGATLIGVYGPALQSAVATIGATGGIWSFITNLADNDTKSLRENKWNYAWLLSRKARY